MTSTLKVDQIQNSSGTGGLSIDSSGAVYPKVPVFHTTLNTNFTLPNLTWTYIDWESYGTLNFDNMSWWDSSNSSYKPQQAGYYQFHSQGFVGSGTIRGAGLEFVKNDLVITLRTLLYVDNEPTGDDFPLSVTQLIYMNGSTDYIRVRGFAHDDDASGDVFVGDNNGQYPYGIFQAHFVST